MAFIVEMQPVGRRCQVQPGDSLLFATQSAGVELAAICGGIGACDTCRVRLIQGTLSPATLIEEGEFSEAQLTTGWRLACQAEPLSDVKIDIPPESLTAAQRLQLEGDAERPALDPLVVAVDVVLSPPTTTDLRSDMTRLNDTLAAMGLSPVSMNLPMLVDLSEKLRAGHWSVRLAIRQQTTVVGVLPPTHAPLGLAVDIGSTSIAAYLVDLSSGAILAKAGAMNPQIAYGEDVISRIMWINQHPANRTLLQERVVSTINDLAQKLCSDVGLLTAEIMDVVLVGNTAMHHIVTGLPVKQLGEAPYVPVTSDSLEFPAAAIGLIVSPGALVYVPPNIAGYVGADHVAVMVATRAGDTPRTAVVIDIGTNTEVMLVHQGQRYTCSCASGPAFEGAHIHDGMRASPGAIERVQIIDKRLAIQTIGGTAPIGICGSGILDAVAGLLDLGVIGRLGAFQKGHALLKAADGPSFELASASVTGHGRPVVVTRKDVSEIQLAKSAIRTGIDLLLEKAGIDAGAIDDFIIAGAFGTYINVKSALRIGMFPPIPVERITQVGNAAGMGAWHLLISKALREQARQLATAIDYVELTTHPKFQDLFVENLEM
jgi:uncharacterized 2Fe-2S/4Fe-4S cluster protein (DUF4445 family)